MGKRSPAAFRLPLTARGIFFHTLVETLRTPIERLLALQQLNALYSRLPSECSTEDFLSHILDALEVSVSVNDKDFSSIPKTGKAIVVANHPFGAIEGIVLASILRAVRPDVKIMANHVLAGIPELRDCFIFVDPFGGKESAKNNVRPLREALGWLDQGGMLAVFPAGEVSSFHPEEGIITDPKWSASIGRIMRRTQSPVLPVYFHGANSPIFHAAGLVHARLRTVLLPRELLNKRGTTIELAIGKTIPARIFSEFGSDAEAIEYARSRSYWLQHRFRSVRSAPVVSLLKPVEEAQSIEVLSQNIAALAPENILLEHNEFLIFQMQADDAPAILREIGQLRERTFRANGEGTGKATDTDEFDAYYTHIVLWNKAKNEIVGSYRLGRTDIIIKKIGIKGLYTNTLFRLTPEFLRLQPSALELGRSFIREEYQKTFAPLLLLWRGIGEFLLRHPQYRILFGPVSISANYTEVSRIALSRFLTQKHFDHFLSHFVQARTPFVQKLRDNEYGITDSHSLEEVSDLISAIEADGKGVPVLVRHYLKLGASFLGFNVDKNFCNALDGLVIVDLCKTEHSHLERYLGKKGAQSYLAFHREKNSDVANSTYGVIAVR